MKKAVLAILVVAIIGAMCFAAVSCKNDTTPTVVECEELTMLMEGNYYVGTEGTVDLATALPGSGYTVSGSNASVADNVLTVTAEGDFNLTYTPTDTEAEGIKEDGTVTLNVHAVNGVNVSDWAGFSAAVKAAKNVVFQNDIVTEGKESIEVTNTIFYGNAKSIILYSIVDGTAESKETLGPSGINITGNGKATFKDLFVYGYKYAEGETATLERCEGFGSLINITNDDSSKRPVVSVEHCILENARKIMYIRGADVTIQGTVLRNGADALVAIETSSVKGSNVTVKDCAFANSAVCGIILCGWTEANSDSYCTLNLEGFVDIYNWKSRDTAKLMPAGEDWEGTVNTLVQEQLSKEKYDSYFTQGDDGKDYVHFGVVVLATGNLKSNNSTVNGYDKMGLIQKKFPLPGYASIIAHTCLLYGIDGGNLTIKPTESLDDNTALSYELLHGRQE